LKEGILVAGKGFEKIKKGMGSNLYALYIGDSCYVLAVKHL